MQSGDKNIKRLIPIVMSLFFDVLPTELKEKFVHLPMSQVNEIRLRVNAPVVICINGRNMVLDDVSVTRTDLDTILHKASNYSIYSVNEQLKQGFLTIRGGIRIGIAAEIVTEHGEVLSVKNIHALNVRIPHEIRNCSYPILNYIFENPRPLKTLIISPPGCGKTTFLRDLSLQISDKYQLLNTLILDERGEIAANHLGENQLDVGSFTDVISGCTKSYGFENGIRSMRPDVIITDEVATKKDIEMLSLAARSGVSVIATVHASGIDEIRTKPYFKELIDDRVFARYIVLEGLGKVSGVYDKNLKLLAL